MAQKSIKSVGTNAEDPNASSPFFYPQTEIGKYYKKLAGYDIELPPPSCRETKLLSNLIDDRFNGIEPETDYFLEFYHNGEIDSWIEKLLCSVRGYTWYFDDIWNHHRPESDAEKYLYLMGGFPEEVIEFLGMPNPNACERNFWMDKAVKRWNENKPK